MQVDLISRDFSVKALREYAEQKHAGGEVELANGILKAVCFLEKKENVPTAYSVEKVVAELEDKAEEHRNIAFDMEAKGFSGIADKQYAKQLACINAIEIVRNGGKE